MEINDRLVEQIIVKNEKGEVLAVISDTEIIERKNVSVVIDFTN